jgi:AsmA protein
MGRQPIQFRIRFWVACAETAGSMRRSQHPLRRLSAVIAACALALLIAFPFIIEQRDHDLALRGASVLAASRDSYSLSEPVRLMKTPVVDLESGTIAMQGRRAGIVGGGEMLAMLITGKSARMTLNNATISTDFTTTDAASGEISPPGGVAPLVSAFRQLKFDALGVRDSAIRIKTGDGGILLLENVSADITTKANGTIHAAGSFAFRGEKVEFDTTLRASSDPESGARPILATLKSATLNAKLEGTLMTGDSPRILAPQAELTIPNLRRAARWLGADWRSGPGFENFSVKGPLEWGNRTVAFQQASVRMDDNDASGTLSVGFAGPRPAIEGTLSLKALNLSKYIPGSDQPADATAPRESLLTQLRKSRTAEFPLIQTVDADLRISSDSVVVGPRLTIGRSAVTISLKDAKLLADIAELEIEEGTHGGGQVRIDASGPVPSYDVRGKLEALDVGHLAEVVFGHPTVQGHGDIIVEVTAAGANGDDILRSLGGKMSVSLAEGGLLGLDVNKLVTAVNAPQPSDVWRDASSGAIAVDKLDARFAVAQGKLRTEDAVALSGGRKMSARGTVDLPLSLIDVRFDIGDRAKTDGAAPGAKGEVIDMHGPWTDPAVRAGEPKN